MRGEGENNIKENSQCCYGAISMFVCRICKTTCGVRVIKITLMVVLRKSIMTIGERFKLKLYIKMTKGVCNVILLSM